MLRAPKADGLGHGWFGQRALAILMVGLTVAVLWGTMYPLFLRVLRNIEISVTPEFFRVVCTPLGVAVLAIFAVSPLLPGQSVENRRREIVVRAVVGGVTFLVSTPSAGGRTRASRSSSRSRSSRSSRSSASSGCA
jgi:cytochrome c biogenesis factor